MATRTPNYGLKERDNLSGPLLASTPGIQTWGPSRLRSRGSYRMKRVSDPSCWGGDPPYVYVYTYVFPQLSQSEEKVEATGVIWILWLLSAFACADPCDWLYMRCIHVRVPTSNECSALLLVKPGSMDLWQPCHCQDVGSGPIFPTTMHTPCSFQKILLWSKTHILPSLFPPWFALCSSFSVSIWSQCAQQLPINFPVLSPLQFPNQASQHFKG